MSLNCKKLKKVNEASKDVKSCVLNENIGETNSNIHDVKKICKNVKIQVKKKRNA